MSLIASALDPGVITLADQGILPWINSKGAQAQDTLRTIASLVAIGFLIFTAFKTRGALSSIIVAGLVAGVFLWIVWNVTALRDRVGDEVNNTSMPAVVLHTTDLSSPPPRTGTGGWA